MDTLLPEQEDNDFRDSITRFEAMRDEIIVVDDNEEDTPWQHSS